jgi:hypothetical protein
MVFGCHIELHEPVLGLNTVHGVECCHSLLLLLSPSLLRLLQVGALQALLIYLWTLC